MSGNSISDNRALNLPSTTQLTKAGAAQGRFVMCNLENS